MYNSSLSKQTSSFTSIFQALHVNFQLYKYIYNLQVQVYKFYKFTSSLTTTFLALQVQFQFYKFTSSFTCIFLALQVHFQLYKHNSSFTFYKLNLLLFKNTSNFLRCFYILVEKTEWFNVRWIVRGECKGSTVIY